MNTTCLILILISSAVLMRGTAYAAQTNVERGHTNLTRVDRPRKFPNNRERSTSGNAVNLHRPAFYKPAGAAKGGFIQNETVKGTVPVRSPSVVRPTAATLSNVRHHGPNPATVGGLGNSATSNNGSINGTRMRRRP